MGVVHLLVPADGIHIGEQPLADIELVALQGETLPLGQRVNYLSGGSHIGNVEGDRALHTVEVVVKTRILIHKQGGGHPTQIQGITQIHLKITLDEFNGPLHFVDGEGRMIPLGDRDFAHLEDTSFFIKHTPYYTGKAGLPQE